MYQFRDLVALLFVCSTAVKFHWLLDLVLSTPKCNYLSQFTEDTCETPIPVRAENPLPENGKGVSCPKVSLGGVLMLSDIASQNAPRKWAFATQSEI